MNKKQSIVKALCAIIILMIFYAIEYYYRYVYNIMIERIVFALFLVEIEAFLIGVFMSYDHIKTWRINGKIKINYIFAILAIIFILLRIPYTTFGFIYSIRMLRFLVMLFFWYALAHAFYKIPIKQSDGNDTLNNNQH